jgi:hypothetical protein
MSLETYNVAQAAAYLKCHPETVREMIRSGKLVAAKIGRSYCIRQIHLDALIAEAENQSVQALARSRSKQQCQTQLKAVKKQIKPNDCLKSKQAYTNETVLGILTSGRQAAKELDALLAHKTTNKPKNCWNN